MRSVIRAQLEQQNGLEPTGEQWHLLIIVRFRDTEGGVGKVCVCVGWGVYMGEMGEELWK